MKKYLLLLLLFIPGSVYAETFYTPYILKEENVSEYYKESDTLRCEEIKLYNNYNYQITNENYYQLNQNASISPLLDLNDTIKNNSYVKSAGSIYEGPYTTFWIRKYNTTHYLVFRSFEASGGIFNYIKIYNKNKEINYQIISSNYQFGNSLVRDSEIVIDLQDYYLLSDLVIETNFTENTMGRIAYMIRSYVEYYYGSPYYSDFSNEIIRGKTTENYKVNFLFYDDYVDLLKKILWINASNYSSTYEINYYTYPTTLYKYYNLEKTYANVYSEEPMSGYYLDENDYKIYYTYYQRDKIEIIDKITTKEDINNLVISSTTADYKIISDINTNINGEYLLVIIIDDTIFYKEIVVDIPNETDLIKNTNPTTTTKRITTSTIKSNNNKTTASKVIPSTTKSNKNVESREYKYSYLLGLIVVPIYVIFKIIRGKKDV